MANFIPMILQSVAGNAVEGGLNPQQGPPDGKVPSSKYTQQAQAQQPPIMQQPMPPTTGWMDLLAASSMQGQQPAMVKRGSNYPTNPMNDQNSWWSMFR